ncbi:MAG: acyltransferase [Alphaproteobacteria bacterium]|nr:acyltransferase [Alphaproteobacteria bacterium]
MKDTSRIDFANTLRGFAAIAVVISHYYGVFWQARAAVGTLLTVPELPIDAVPTPLYINWINQIPLINWGCYGVALFFLISGFVIPFSLYSLNGAGFLVNRLLRIVPTYVAGFSLTLLAIGAGVHYFDKPWPFELRNILIHYIPGLRDLMGVPSIDGIIWTLEIEMKFYVLCALFVGWFKRNSIKVFILPLILFILALWVTRHLPFLGHIRLPYLDKVAAHYMLSSQYIIFMFIGVFFHYLHQGRLAADKAILGVGGLFACFALHWWSGPYAPHMYQMWSYAFALLTFSFAFSFQRFFASNRIFDFFANISYPLYVVHGVAGYALLRIALDYGLKAWQSLLGVTVVAIACAWLVHVLVEMPTRRLGKYLGKKVTERVNAPSLPCFKRFSRANI